MESPEFVRLSLAAAMTLGLAQGTFYRGARLRCINLLLTYEAGCKANCAFCGLAREKDEAFRDRKFIRVAWKTYPAAEILDRLTRAPKYVERVCISMITHPRSRPDVLTLCRAVRSATNLPVSLLISPTILNRPDLDDMKAAGAERIGVAVDAATPEIFDRLRGRGVHGPHRWDHYWSIYQQVLEVFGFDMAGVHLIVGLGETEQDMVQAIGRAREMGGRTHLFSFFPEVGSAMADHAPPPIGQYRRIQVARHLIDNDLARPHQMAFDPQGRIIGFGLDDPALLNALSSGVAFETSGCPGPSGRTACNRPYGNERPGPDIRNFPFTLEQEDSDRVWAELWQDLHT